MDIVSQNSTSYTTVNFFDKTGAPTVPSAATYAIKDLLSDSTVLAPIAVGGLAASVTLTISAALNAILNPANAQEIRQITVVSNYGDGSQLTSVYYYAVANLAYGL